MAHNCIRVRGAGFAVDAGRALRPRLSGCRPGLQLVQTPGQARLLPIACVLAESLLANRFVNKGIQGWKRCAGLFVLLLFQEGLESSLAGSQLTSVAAVSVSSLLILSIGFECRGVIGHLPKLL